MYRERKAIEGNRIQKYGVGIDKDRRQEYFDGFTAEEDQVVLLDPDRGFEPQTPTEKHIRYDEVFQVLDQASAEDLDHVMSKM